MSLRDDYERCDGLGLAALVQKREVSAEELLEAAILRVEARNPAINAVIDRFYDKAKATITAGLPSGPFTGVPYLLKDYGTYLTGTRTTGGSRLFRDFVADHDSEIVRRLERAGLVIFGKTNTSEFGLLTSVEPELFGPTRNPWAHGRSAGGSSGGAAAAVASGMVPMAHASDGGGSIRIPASCCGLFGLKPTRARTPMGPDLGEGWSGASVAHAVTRSVRDSAALLDATAGPDIGDPYWAPPPRGAFLAEIGADPGRLRIALMTRSLSGRAVHPECVAAASAAARLCESLGHHVSEAAPDVDEAARGEATRVIIAAQTRAKLEARAEALGRPLRPDDVEALTWATAEYGHGTSASAYVKAIETMHRFGRAIGRFFGKFDVLVTPTLSEPPHELGVITSSNADRVSLVDALLGSIAFTSPFNTAGTPAMSVPLHWSRDGLPIGVQFAAGFGEEATLFRLAAQLEKAQPWAHRRPPL